MTPGQVLQAYVGAFVDEPTPRRYGAHAKWSARALVPGASDAALRSVRTLAGRAAAVARSAPAGPVHLNSPSREPLIPEPVDPPASADLAAWLGRANGA